MSEISFLSLTEFEKRELCPVPPPKSPAKDWRWWSLWIPSVIGAFGLFLFNVPGIAFIQLHDQPASFLRFFVITGSLLMMFGSDVGSVFAIFEVFRKHATGEVGRWDWVGLGVSCGASIFSSLLSWSWQLQDVGVEAGWIAAVKVYGPAMATVFIILDLVISAAEAGMFLGTHDKRHREWEKVDFQPWLKEKERELKEAVQWEREQYNQPTQLSPVEKTSTPVRVKRCWCGAPCPIGTEDEMEQWYQQHCQEIHAVDVWMNGTDIIRDAYTARQILVKRYEGTSAQGDWPIPPISTISQWRKQFS